MPKQYFSALISLKNVNLSKLLPKISTKAKKIQNVNPTDLRDQTHGSIAWIDRAGLQTC